VSDERARLFVALDLPAPVRDELAAWAAREAGDLQLRLLEPEMLHVTLCFLGWRAAADAERIGELALACAAPVPELAVAGGAWLPPRRPRVLAVDLDDPTGAAAGLQARVSEAMVRGAGYEPERRAWRPHVTVGRVPKGARVRATELAAPPSGPFAGAGLSLYRSHLRRQGARYEPVAHVRL
jgi:RNA 2',3'-cyclic 3'-phosphodiesterase